MDTHNCSLCTASSSSSTSIFADRTDAVATRNHRSVGQPFRRLPVSAVCLTAIVQTFLGVTFYLYSHHSVTSWYCINLPSHDYDALDVAIKCHNVMIKVVIQHI